MELLSPSPPPPPLATPPMASSAAVDVAVPSRDDTTGDGRTSSSPLSATAGSSFPAKPPPKRSQIIQQLSLLVGFLEWIRPSAPNSELCQIVARIIRHILDQTLDGPPRGVGPDDTAPLVDWNTVDFATDVSNYFNFDLLDTFDWL